MVNDFMVCVDRILASAASFQHHHSSANNNFSNNEFIQQQEIISSKVKEMKECRICQEEDDHEDDNSLESPCACNGSLKYAHRACIQKWCNKKGDITCEICNQVFAPNYSLPPESNPDVMAVDISQAWSHQYSFRDHHLLALAAAERQLLESEYDEYAATNAGNLTYLRSIAIILMFVLLIHQVLMITRDFGLVQGYMTFFRFEVSFLQLAGLLLPCYVLVRSWYILYILN